MKKILLVTAVSVMMSGCIVNEQNDADKVPTEVSEVCIGGVTYVVMNVHYSYQGYGYMSVKFGTDSKVVLCQPTSPVERF